MLGVVSLAAGVDTAAAEAAPKKARCVVDIDSQKKTVSINGTALASFDLGVLHKLLGKPSRIKAIKKRVRFERKAYNSNRRTSRMVPVTVHYYVWDRLGLVFNSGNLRKFDKRTDPERMVVFFPRKRSFTHSTPPAMTPKRRGVCKLRINGETVPANRSVVPKGVDYRTNKFAKFKTHFGPTSFTTQIDSLYSSGGAPYLRLYLDGPQTHRVSYVVIR